MDVEVDSRPGTRTGQVTRSEGRKGNGGRRRGTQGTQGGRVEGRVGREKVRVRSTRTGGRNARTGGRKGAAGRAEATARGGCHERRAALRGDALQPMRAPRARHPAGGGGAWGFVDRTCAHDDGGRAPRGTPRRGGRSGERIVHGTAARGGGHGRVGGRGGGGRRRWGRVRGGSRPPPPSGRYSRGQPPGALPPLTDGGTPPGRRRICSLAPQCGGAT